MIKNLNICFHCNYENNIDDITCMVCHEKLLKGTIIIDNLYSYYFKNDKNILIESKEYITCYLHTKDTFSFFPKHLLIHKDFIIKYEELKNPSLILNKLRILFKIRVVFVFLGL